MRSRVALFVVVLALAVLAGIRSASAADDPAVKQAREQFLKGAQLVKEADWAGALAAFEESARLRPHAVTTYNIGACLRAVGQYTRARKVLTQALADNEKANNAELSGAALEEAKQAQREIEKLLGTLDVTLSPETGRVAVDGKPLEPAGTEDSLPVLLAGVLPAGPGKDAPKGRFRVIVDPGTHVITVSREGFADAVKTQTVAPGSKTELKLELDRLPAQLVVTSNQAGAQVLVNDADVGLAPVEVSRPAGKYHVLVRKKGFLDFDATTNADPGQRVNVPAVLREDKPALTSRWWFWTGVGVLVVGAAVTTYFVTRPDPERPGLDGGGLGWTVKTE